MAFSIRVRFAPSPTGALHVGGARTALFNYLFAKHHQGKFLLRIEDTDVQRSRSELTEQILRSLKWLGLDWDEEIVFQSDRRANHRELCEALLEKGAAYRCFCDSEMIAEKRSVQEAKTGGYRYDRTCLSLGEEEIRKRIHDGIPYAVRFRVPDGETAFDDLVHGDTVFRHAELDDFVILRSDGTPVYQVAVVADDHDMGITHVIRGDDHLSNTPKQILLFQSMGWDVPRFAHVPMIWGPDKKRLSKRHGATSVEAFRESGYLSDALANFLSLLGWSPGDDSEILSLDTLIQKFSIEGISRNPAVFDEQKLEWMNGQYIRSKSLSELLELALPYLQDAGFVRSDHSGFPREYLLRFVELMRDRVKRLTDFAQSGVYFFRDPETYDDAAVKKYWPIPETTERMQTLSQILQKTEDWTETALEARIRELAESLSIGAGKLIHPLRLALTGQSASPGLFEMMALLGKETVFRRLTRAFSVLGAKSFS